MGVRYWETARREWDPEELARLRASGLTGLAAKVLAARGVGSMAEASEQLGARDALFDPFLLRDMDKAVERILAAIRDGERIVVYGDYDCDGVTSTALLTSYLEAVGADVLFYIPDREQEGYGLNNEALDFLREVRGAELIITVDNGVSAHAEIAHAREIGLDVVVTDHHQPRETLPEAVAVVDPHRPDCPSPFKGLAGVGVAFKLVCALDGDDGSELIEQYGDLTALGTIGDVMPLTHDNRTFVRHGLGQLADSIRPGIRALIRAAGLEGRTLTATNVAFGLVPRLNAAGRMGDVYDALELLLTESETTAAEKAEILCGYNDRRKEIEGQILSEVAVRIQQDPSLVRQRAILIDGAGWHHGVIGILCSKLVEKYGRPAFLISTDEKEGRSSGRSIDGVSVIEAVAACGDLLSHYGGHAAAAGFTVPLENLPAFRERFEGFFRERYPIMPYDKLEVTGVVEPAELTVPEVQGLSRLEPFGAGNPLPLFEIDGARLERIQPLSGGKHLRLGLSKDGTAFQALLFGTGPDQFGYLPGDLLDLVVTAEISVYREVKSVALKVEDLRLHGVDQEAVCYQRRIYENALGGEHRPEEDALICPTREDAAVVYRYLNRHGGFAGDADLLWQRLMGSGIGYGRLLVVLDAMEEQGLITREAGGFRVLPVSQKVDLMNAAAICRLRGTI